MNAAIVNAGGAAWVFEEFARRLARVLQLEVSATPADYNYLLAWDAPEPPGGKCFIPFDAIVLASDKRRMAAQFAQHGVATPRTCLLDTPAEVEQLVRQESHHQWVLKWPTGCGGSGHRLQPAGASIPDDWPRPYVLQQFIDLEVPEVYRLYCVAGETLGWNARRFAPGTPVSPFVAHARGARYEAELAAPAEATTQARRALTATNLLHSFGCADLMRDAQSRWLVLETNTDGVFNHVDRDIDIANIASEIDERIAAAFWTWVRREEAG